MVTGDRKSADPCESVRIRVPFLKGTGRKHRRSIRFCSLLLLLLPALLFCAGCAPNMSEQPRYNPLAPGDFFHDGRSARPAIPGTVSSQALASDSALTTGKRDGNLVDRIPLPVSRALLLRGRERFDIFCSPCHGRTGDGTGMIARRGFRQPPSYFIPRLREAPDGHIFEVITKGVGEMDSYAARVSPADRWAITAYVRALQFSRAASLADVPSPEQGRLLGQEK